MSTKVSISSGDQHHLYFELYLDSEPGSVFLEINEPREFLISRESHRGGISERLVVEISAEMMDEIAGAWMKKRVKP